MTSLISSRSSEVSSSSSSVIYWLDNGLSVLFSRTTDFSYNQQFTFQSKITALVTNATSIPIPQTMYTLQQFYSYISTTTPSDIVIKTNNNEKMRITADGSISIQNSYQLHHWT